MLRDSTSVIVIIVMFLFSNMIFLNFYSDVWWDSSVYIGMGKYIYSFGKSGLWEDYRLPLFPLVIGLGWALNIDFVLFGRILSLIFACLAIYMTYKLGKEIFSKQTGLIASFFIAFSYTFFFFSGNILTEIPSTFFALLAFYLLFKERYFFVGFFAGVSIMFRIFHIFVFLGAFFLFIFYFCKKRHFVKSITHAICGALSVILPYLILNGILYNDIFKPFKVQTFFVQTTAWNLYRNGWFYLTALLKENFFLILLPSLIFFYRKDYKLNSILTTSLLYIFVYSFVKHKEMRYMIVILPLVYILTSHCISSIYRNIKQKGFFAFLFIILIGVWTYGSFTETANTISYQSQKKDEALHYFQEYLKNAEGAIWITNPLYALYSNKKIDGLLYYYSSENLIDFVSKNNANVVLINNCDIACPPKEHDPYCEESHKILYNKLKTYRKIYSKQPNFCVYEIFTS